MILFLFSNSLQAAYFMGLGDLPGGDFNSRARDISGLPERIQQGGAVGYIIIGIGLLGMLLVIVRLIYLSWVGRRIKRQLREPDEALDDNPLAGYCWPPAMYRTGISMPPNCCWMKRSCARRPPCNAAWV